MVWADVWQKQLSAANAKHYTAPDQLAPSEMGGSCY